jgi:MFS family permease
VVERFARLAGAPLAGVLIAATGATNVLWIDAASFLVSAALVAVGVPRPAVEREPRKTSYRRELREGYAFLRADRTLAVLVFIVSLTNLFDAVAMIALPVLAHDIYESALSLGLMTAAGGAGSVLGALAFAAIGHRLSRRAVFTWGFIFVTLSFPVAAFFPPLAVLLVAKTISGLASGPLNPVIDTVFMERVPAGMRGRVFGVTQAAAWVAIPLGVLVAGAVIEAIGLRATLLLSGAAYLTITIAARFSTALRDLDRRPELVSKEAA